MGSSILLRGISQKGAAPGYSLRRCIFRSVNSSCLGGRMMSTTSTDESPSSPARSSPWLTLKPAFEGGDMVYRFYNLAENRVLSYPKRGGGGEESVVEMPDDDAKFVGSSHGWLAFLNRRNNDLFLSDPLSRRHIKLPPLDSLPDPEINMIDGRAVVSKVIITCPPDEEDLEEDEEFRAVMTYGPGDRMAVCSPGRSMEWTPIGFPYCFDDNPVKYTGRVYEEFVYYRKRHILTGITNFDIELEDWDLRKPRCGYIECLSWNLDDYSDPPIVWSNMRCFRMEEDKDKCSWWKENEKLLEQCQQIPYLVYAPKQQEEELFFVLRFVKGRMKNHPYYSDWVEFCPYKTIGFCVFKVRGPGILSVMDDSLDGLVMFVGMNHSFAMSAAEFPELKPDSIYFTDAHQLTSKFYGGYDIGIFDYQNKTFSDCYYPNPFDRDFKSLKKIVPPPMWFTPSNSKLV